MSDKQNIKCCVCKKEFSAVYNLTKHARKYHSDQVNIIVPRKIYNYQCTQCHKNFSLLKNFNYHKKSHQNLSDISCASKKVECPICKLSAPKKNLISHFEVEHDIKCVIQTIDFSSIKEFSNWKTDMEHETKSKYVVERGSQCTKNGTKTIKYCCHRSGKYVSRGKGIRQLKMQGSNKIGGFCPAHLKLTIDKKNECKVFFMDQHVGHDEHDLGHLFLTFQERQSLANKMALNVPFTQILADIQDSVKGSKSERIHLVKRRDLSNIEKSFLFQSTVVHHGNDAVNDDALQKTSQSSDCVVFYELEDDPDLLNTENPSFSEVSGVISDIAVNEVENISDDHNQLDREKQKLIDNFKQLIESVTTMEQLDVAKKLCISLGSTLEAIETKQLSKPCKSICFSSPTTKKITPHEGNHNPVRKKH